MGFFDSLKHSFNPEVRQTFDNLYKNYYKGLKTYCEGTGGSYGGYTFHKIYLSTSMSYADMKSIYESRDLIMKLHKTIIESEKMEADYKELENLRRNYPHAFISICDECLGGIIYDSSIEMPGCRYKSETPRQNGTYIIGTAFHKYYNNQYKPLGGGYFSSFPQQQRYSREPKSVRDLLYPDVVKILQKKNQFQTREQGILTILNEEDISHDYTQKVINNQKRSKYASSFLKSRGKSSTDKKFVLSNLTNLDNYINEEISKEYKRIHNLYPNGLKVFESEISSIKEHIISNEQRIAELETNAKKYLSYSKWEREQKEYTDFSRSVNPTQFGCYSYTVPFKKIDKDGNPQSGTFKVWQHFYDSFYGFNDIEGMDEYLPNIANNSMKFMCLFGKTQSYPNSAFERAFEIIKKIKEKYGLITVVWGTSSFRDYIDINNYHFGYFRSLLNENHITNVDANELSSFGISRHIIIIDITSSNSWLKTFCDKIIKENQRLRPLLTYITFCKMYDKEEIEDLIKKKKKIQEENKKKKEEEERKKQLEIKKTQDLKQCVSTWYLPNRSSVNCFSLYNYYPTTCDWKASEKEWDVRNLVWDFKANPHREESVTETISLHQDAVDEILPQIKKCLLKFFSSLVPDLTLVCIPSSKKIITERRYKDFSERLTSETGIKNGYDYVKIVKEGMSKNDPANDTGCSIQPEISIDDTFFKGKRVLLFDDVITTGKSMERFKYMLEEKGAIVIGGLSIGRTRHTRQSHNPIDLI